MKKESKNKVISLMTKCAICSNNTTKKHFEEGVYLCTECYNLSDMDKFFKIIQTFFNHKSSDYLFKIITNKDLNSFNLSKEEMKDLDDILEQLFNLPKDK